MKHGKTTLLVVMIFFAIAQITSADTFTVTNTDDSGTGSLRQAITDANEHAGLDTIAFNIPGTGVHTITPATQLPFLTSPVTIDGYTQPGSSANTLANGDNAVLLIEISGAILSNNGNALVLQANASGSTIRGLVINNGWDIAILVQIDTVSVEGCFLGTDPDGSIASSNTSGVFADFNQPTSGMRVGGTSPATRNVISGNNNGIFIQSGSNHLVQGNFIGTDRTGANALPNGTGIVIQFGNNCLIGGTIVAARNIVGANQTGITVSPSTGPSIQGNYIGTDVTGTIALGLGDGIRLDGAAQIGGLTLTPGTPPGNVLSGNRGGGGSGRGIVVSNNVNGNVIQGNLIGTDATGTQPLGNGLDGMQIFGAGNMVGGTDAMARNVISSNGVNGISLGTDNAPVHDNLIQGNFIGTDITGTQLLGNGLNGVFVNVSTNNTIGGPVTTAGAPPGNVIAGNANSGVFLNATTSITGLSVLGNSIFSNAGLGIDLNGDGISLNDEGDPDTGPNNLQNYPVINTVSIDSGNVTLTGSLNSTASATFRLEFFCSAKADPGGFGEGEMFLGFSNVTTNASGDASYSVTFPVSASARAFSATATDPNGNTSEFSPAFLTRLLNISTRMKVLTNEKVLIGGFIITGTGPKKVIVRGIGPSLGALGVPGALADPTLELHGPVSINNDNWRSDQEAEIIATGLPPSNDLEAAIVANLQPSAYTAILGGKDNTTGVGLVEVYDLDQSAGSKLANISTRGFVDTGDNVMIGGLIAGPNDIGATQVLIRGIGPSLIGVGIQDALLDPTMELHDGSGTTIAMNDNWRDTQQAEIEATGIAPTDDRESAILQNLDPGSYTAIVRGKNNTTGVALVEAYNLQ